MDSSNSDASTSGGTNSIMVNQSRQFTGARTKQEFRDKDARRRRRKKSKERGEKLKDFNDRERIRKDNSDLASIKRRKKEGTLDSVQLQDKTIELNPIPKPQVAPEVPQPEDVQPVQPEDVQPQPDVINLGQRVDERTLAQDTREFASTVGKGLLIASLFIPGAAIGGGIIKGGIAAARIAKLAKASKGIKVNEQVFQAIRNKLALKKFLTHNPTTTITVDGVTSEVNKIAGTFNWARVANNAKNYGLKKTYLQKLASAAKSPFVVLGILSTTLYTSLFWAPNEKGDALLALQITQGAAAKNGDYESVQEIDDLMQETLDISASIPVVGFIKSELAKFKAAALASKTYLKEAERVRAQVDREEAQGESDFAKSRRESDEASFQRKRDFADEEGERFEQIRQENQARDLREAEVMQEVFRLRRAKKFEEADALELQLLQGQ